MDKLFVVKIGGNVIEYGEDELLLKHAKRIQNINSWWG